jgi:hypothetical protein
MHLELVILEGMQTGRRISLARMPVTFGRSSSAGTCFPMDSFMSGLHLTVQNALSGVVLVDMQSSNGTFLNGERIRHAIAVPGDVIKIGTLTMKLEVGKSPLPEIAVPEPPKAHEATVLTTVFSVPEILPEPVREPIAVKLPGIAELLQQSGQPLFCLLDSEADEALPVLLGAARDRKESLRRDDPTDTAALGPWLIEFGTGSPFLQALIEGGWKRGWASFFTSEASFSELSAHFGKFYRVQLEAGGVYFRFYDPLVLREFLPVASKEELEVFFGPVGRWLLETEDGVGVLQARYGTGGLQTDILPLVKNEQAAI